MKKNFAFRERPMPLRLPSVLLAMLMAASWAAAQSEAPDPMRILYERLCVQPEDETLLDLLRIRAAVLPDGEQRLDAMTVHVLGHLALGREERVADMRNFLIVRYPDDPNTALLTSTNLTAVCSACEGSGCTESDCASCGASGKCVSCGGDGWREFPGLNGARRRAACMQCSGKGVCRACGGDGRRQAPCVVCAGRGRISDPAAAKRSLMEMLVRLAPEAPRLARTAHGKEEMPGAATWSDMSSYVAAVQALRSAAAGGEFVPARMEDWIANRAGFTGRVVRSEGVVRTYHPRSIAIAPTAQGAATVVVTPDTIGIGVEVARHLQSYGSEVPMMFTVGVLSPQHALLFAAESLMPPPEQNQAATP